MLDGNGGIGDDGAEALGAMLARNRTLTGAARAHLPRPIVAILPLAGFAHCPRGPLLMRAAAAAAAELSLWGASVTDRGAAALAAGLRANAALRCLWLGECEGITDAGAAALRDALRHNCTLQQLALVCTQVRAAAPLAQRGVRLRAVARVRGRRG